MYNYLLFVLIGILLFLLFNNKNKFSIGFPDHSESSQSGESDEDDRPQNTVPQIAAAVGQAHDSSNIPPVPPGIFSFATLEPEILTSLCAAGGVFLLGTGAVASRVYSNYKNPRQQQLSQSDIETGDHDP